MNISSIEAAEVFAERQVTNDVYGEATDPSRHVDNATVLKCMSLQTGKELLGVSQQSLLLQFQCFR